MVWRQEWGAYQQEDVSGHAIVDGGLLSNFPIELFVSKDSVVQSVMGSDAGDHVLGLLIDETCTVEGATMANPGSSPQREVMPVLQRLQQLLNTATGAHDKMVMDAYEDLVVRLPAKGYGTTEFGMDENRRNLLVKAGQAAMSDYFDRLAMAPLSFDVQPEAAAVNSAMEDRAKQKADKVARKILKI